MILIHLTYYIDRYVKTYILKFQKWGIKDICPGEKLKGFLSSSGNGGDRH